MLAPISIKGWRDDACARKVRAMHSERIGTYNCKVEWWTILYQVAFYLFNPFGT